MDFNEFLVSKGYEIKEPVLNDDGTTKEDGTSAEEMAKYYNEFNTIKREELTKAITDDVENKNKEAIAALKAELIEAQAEQLKTLNSVLKEHGMMLKRMNDIADGDVSMTGKGNLYDALKDSEDTLKSMADSRDGKTTIKVVGDMTITGNVSGGNIPVEQRESGINDIAKRKTFIRELVNNGTATSSVISWVEKQNQEGSAGSTAEGTLKNQIDFDLVVVSENVKKITAFIKVSTEMLGDIDFMKSEIEKELMSELALDIDDQILNGNNVGQNLNGIIPQATAWAAGAFALTVQEANLVDVLTVAANQIEVANHEANAHVVHPTDLTTLRLLKDNGASGGQYVSRLLDVSGTLTLDGIRVVSNTGITQDNFLTMDGSKDTVFSKGEMTIQIGLDSDDFTKNFRTILVEWRGLNRIKGNDKTAFVTGVISTSKTALEKP